MIPPPGSRFAALRRLAVSLVVASVAAACTAAPGATGATGAATPSSVTTTSAAAATAGPTAEASSSLSPAPPRSTAPPGEEPSLEPPPGATLVAADGSHPGEVGSWAWAGGTSDAPWLPARALDRAEVRVGTATVRLDDGITVESWAALAASADDAQGADVEPLGDGVGVPALRLTRGDWVVAVHVRFADGMGSAVYYWHLVVS